MLKEKARSCLQSYDFIVGAWLFGSRASGNTHDNSDVDLAILGAEPLTLDQRLELQQALEVALREPRIDVVDLRRAGPVLRFEALQGSRLLIRSDEEVAQFSSLVGREYESALALIKLGYKYREDRPA
jgi:predicted nucleotidyltransferase